MPTGKNEHRSQERRPDDGRSRLLRVAMRQIAAQGFDGVTVRSIAAEADVSPGLIKHHFGSKEGLRDAVDALFLQRSSAAFERAMAATQGMDPEGVAEYEKAWLVRYSEEWPDFVAYLRRAILEASPWGQSLFRRYYESIRHATDRWDVAGRIAPDVDRLWLPLLYAFLLLGPLVLDPHIQAMLGKSTYEPEMWTRYQRAFHSLFWQGAGKRSPIPSPPDFP
jgi:AcrR family transcriptional regulator